MFELSVMMSCASLGTDSTVSNDAGNCEPYSTVRVPATVTCKLFVAML